MFDLFRSRAKATRYLMGGLLMMVAIMMVVTLIPGINAPSRTDSQVLADIGGDALTWTEVQRTVQSHQITFQQPTPCKAAMAAVTTIMMMPLS